MNNIDNEKLLHTAIEDYEPYTKSQRKLLAAFIELAVDDIVSISVISLSKLLGISRFAIYKNLNFLESDNAIKKLNDGKEGRLTGFQLNQDKLNNIEATYVQKQKYINNISKIDKN